VEEEQLVQQDLEPQVGVCGIVGYGQVASAGTVVAVGTAVAVVAVGTVVAVGQHAEGELGVGQFDHPDLRLWKILQEQFVPGSTEPKVSRQAVVAEEQTVVAAEEQTVVAVVEQIAVLAAVGQKQAVVAVVLGQTVGGFEQTVGSEKTEYRTD